MKKRLLALLLASTMALGLLAGCGDSKEANADVESETSEIATEETSETSTEEAAETETTEVIEENHDGMYRSELTGEWIDLSLEKQRPVAVMVDNEITALDHYGLTQADIVYEMMNSTANQEITRFMALVKDWGSITQFGSIRSVRPTNFMIAPEYNAILIHDGGPFYINPYLQNPWIDNLSGGFARIENGKPREFTEYVTTGEIESRLKANKIDSEYNEYYPGAHWEFADKNAPIDLSKETNSEDCTYVGLPFPHNESELMYDAQTDTYLYFEYGKSHIDLANDEKQLAFTNILIQCADVNQLDANGYMEFNIMNQRGAAYYITGGKAIPVTWTKGMDMNPTEFYTAAGSKITLNTGKTYIALVSTDRWDELVIK